ncbi:MAG: uracil phosphoribosyltransferase, partial [Coriobacteriia bacterium]|nr:uracil phosphoribosyltransferase [Coriobacteriia bacterium]
MESNTQYPNVMVMDHPLIQHKLSILRDVGTGAKVFRELVKELAMLMAYEATRDFQLTETTVTTPIEETSTYVLAGKKVAVFPILRAGLGMVEGIIELI